jgi:PAT family beta-lactamase induction signal transducer AmpG
MAKHTSKQFSVTQLALLFSIVTVARTFATATTGFIIEAIGYTQFFLVCFLLAIPGMVLLVWVAPWNPAVAEK